MALYADAARAVTVTMEIVAALIEGIFSAAFGLTFGTWTPTSTPAGAMTYTSTTISGKYLQIGKWVICKIVFTGTVGGTPNQYISMSIPATAVSDQICGNVQLTDNGVSPVVGQLTSSGTGAVAVWRYDRVNYTAGTVSGVAYFWYEAA